MALEGLVVLNVLFLVVGGGILWGIRGWPDWGDAAALAGVAYVLGLAATTVAMTLVLIAGGGASTAAILLVMLCLAGAGAVAGGLRQRARPGLGRVWRPRTPADAAAAALALLTAALLGVYAVQASREPLTDWDGWAFWVPKAKVIYFFGGIGTHLFRTFAAPSYPLFVPTLDAMDFRFMGAADTTTLTLQYWLLLVGFLLAAAGLLRSLAAPWLVWLSALTALVMPQLDHRLLGRLADWPLDFFFALAALALVRWLLRGERWALVAAGVALAATFATKREGQLLGAVLVLGTLVALGLRRRRAWVPLLATAAVAYLPDLVWRFWWTAHRLAADTPPGGILSSPSGSGSGVSSFEHLLACLRFVVGLLFSYGLWSGAVPLGLAACAAVLLRPDRRAAILYLVTMAAGLAGWAWVNWAEKMPLTPGDALNPTDRALGSLVLLTVVMTPLFLTRVLHPERPPAAEPGAAQPVAGAVPAA